MLKAQQSCEPEGKSVGVDNVVDRGRCSVEPLLAEFSGKPLGQDAKLRNDLLHLKLGPPYLIHVAVSSRTTAEYIERIFEKKGLIDTYTELYRETRLLANCLDDLVIRDAIDFLQSKAVERIARFLFGMELALRPVTSEATLDRANWAAVKVLQMESEDVDISVGVKQALREARRRASRRARMNRLAKTFAGLEGTHAERIGLQEMERDWQRDWGERWT
jgi:hypothetical protein